MLRCVVVVVLGCAFSAVFWITVQTHRLYPSTSPASTARVTIGALH